MKVVAPTRITLAYSLCPPGMCTVFMENSAEKLHIGRPSLWSLDLGVSPLPRTVSPIVAHLVDHALRGYLPYTYMANLSGALLAKYVLQ